MSSSIHFVSTSFGDESMNSENFKLEQNDPFQEIGNDVHHKCYRIDSLVFAEPLEKNLSECSTPKDADNSNINEEYIINKDNVLVQKRIGKKYKRYYINLEDPTDLSCPQSNCNRTFSSTKLLKAHIRKVHCSDKSAHMCEVCGATFACRYLLVRHAAVHSGRKVRCTVCDALLSQRTSLSAHLRTHSSIKPHTCSICNKQFTRKSTLDTHVKFVHREDQLQCPKCPDRFETRTQLTRHVGTHQRASNRGGAHGS